MNKKYHRLLDEGWEIDDSALSGLNLASAERLKARAYLRAAVLGQIDTLRITQREAAQRTGLTQPKVSTLMSDVSIRGFSSDKLIEIATRLGLDVRIQVRASRDAVGHVVAGAARGRG